MELKDILTVVGLSIPLASLLNLIIYQFIFLPNVNKAFKKFEFELKQKDLINQEQWKHKRDACFNALNIADCFLSNASYPHVKDGDIKPTKITTEAVRKCLNDLACSCEHSEVIEVLKKIIRGGVSPDSIVDLRNAVRKELEFGISDFDKDRENAFIGKVQFDPELNN